MSKLATIKGTLSPILSLWNRLQQKTISRDLLVLSTHFRENNLPDNTFWRVNYQDLNQAERKYPQLLLVNRANDRFRPPS